MERLTSKERKRLEQEAGEFGITIEGILQDKIDTALEEIPSPLKVKLATAELLADDILSWIDEQTNKENPVG